LSRVSGDHRRLMVLTLGLGLVVNISASCSLTNHYFIVVASCKAASCQWC